MLIIFLLLLLSSMVGGCASHMYNWGDYDETLYAHYKHPQMNESYVENLLEIITKGEPSGNVPPGIYAEYGYALYEAGKYDDAVKYFKKESDKWTESKNFMEKMIRNAQRQQEKKEDSSSASAPREIDTEAERQK